MSANDSGGGVTYRIEYVGNFDSVDQRAAKFAPSILGSQVLESLEWDWWTGDRGSESSRYLLPVGVLPDLRLRFDRNLWTMDAVIPGFRPIAATTGVERYKRYLCLCPQLGTIVFQRDPEGNEADLLNSSVASFVGSLGVYAIWASRIRSAGRQWEAVEPLMLEAVEQLNALERASDPSGKLPELWPKIMHGVYEW